VETKQQLTKRFITGLVLIIISLVLGKLVLIPVIIFPGSNTWRISMIAVYAISWLMIIPGIYLAGIEGYRLVKHKYKEYKHKTIHHVKEKSRNAAQKTVKVLRMPVKSSKQLLNRVNNN